MVPVDVCGAVPSVTLYLAPDVGGMALVLVRGIVGM